MSNPLDPLILTLSGPPEVPAPVTTEHSLTIFLDFDGVLNTPKQVEEWRKVMSNDPLFLDQRKVALLNRIEEALHPTWVVSSAWRHVGGGFSTPKGLSAVLENAGFEGVVSGVTGASLATKAMEIAAYIRENKILGICLIIDDLQEAWADGAYFMRTDPRQGLDERQVDRFIAKILREREKNVETDRRL